MTECKSRLLKRVLCLLIFVIRENEISISVICDSLFFSIHEPCDPLNCNVKYMVVIVKTHTKLFFSLTNKLSFFSRSDANRDKVDLIFKQLSLEGLHVLFCSPTLG